MSEGTCVSCQRGDLWARRPPDVMVSQTGPPSLSHRLFKLIQGAQTRGAGDEKNTRKAFFSVNHPIILVIRM